MPARDHRADNAAYYSANREQEIGRVISRQRATVEWLRDLRRVPCSECHGIFPPYAIDFDHRDASEKLFDIAAGKSMLKNRAVLEREIAKCDIVCANCHRARTHALFLAGQFQIPVPPLKERTPERERKLRIFRETREYQLGLLLAFRSTPCFDCHQHFPWFVMEFDHRDPLTKRSNVPFLAGRVGLKRLLEEIEKCDIVCANCHRVRTFSRREAARASAGVA